MADDKNNPRKLALALRLFERGAIGHRFSRTLTKSETSGLRALIESNGHGSCIFVEQQTGLAVGAWLCTCEAECEIQLLMLAGNAKISVIANVQGEKSYVITSDTTIEIQVQQIGVADQARFLQIASVASQVAAQTAGEISAKIAASTAQEVANLTVAETLGSVGDHAAKSATEPRLTFSFESSKPN